MDDYSVAFIGVAAGFGVCVFLLFLFDKCVRPVLCPTWAARSAVNDTPAKPRAPKAAAPGERARGGGGALARRAARRLRAEPEPVAEVPASASDGALTEVKSEDCCGCFACCEPPPPPPVVHKSAHFGDISAEELEGQFVDSGPCAPAARCVLLCFHVSVVLCAALTATRTSLPRHTRSVVSSACAQA